MDSFWMPQEKYPLSLSVAPACFWTAVNRSERPGTRLALSAVEAPGAMRADYGRLLRCLRGAPRQRHLLVGATTGLGLFEYGPIPRSDRGSAITATDADGLVEGGSLLCLTLAAPRLPGRLGSANKGGIASVAFHLAVFSIVISLAAWPRSAQRSVSDPSIQPTQVPRLVFLLRPGPGGGGGGGGDKRPREPSGATAIGHDRVTVPVSRAADVPHPNGDALPPPQQVLLEAKPLASGTMVMPGLVESSPSLLSRGPGSGEGVGTGTGSGIGSGTGSGVGTGSGGGFGGGVYRLGSGVVPPRVLKQVTPRYTADAMRQRIQGMVALEVVVSREGVPVAIRVTRSLDPGLDDEAIAAAREWRFAPGRVGNTPVDVLVTILLDFNIR
jgi:periplasmic protein TonB